MVIVYKDVISGDEFISDSYPITPCFNDACIEVKARMVAKDNYKMETANHFGGGDDDEGEDDTPQVIDIVDSFQLNEINFTKKDFAAWAKGYLGAVTKHLTSKGKEERVPEFKKGATEAVKFIMSKIDEMQFFCGQKYDMEGSVCFCYNKDGEAEPTFIFFVDGMKQEKF